MKKTELVQFRLEHDQLATAQEIARKRNQTLSALMRDIINILKLIGPDASVKVLKLGEGNQSMGCKINTKQ